MLRGFYALEDTKTPFFITVGFSIAWMVMAIPLFNLVEGDGQQVAALALTYGLSYWIGMAIAWFFLARKLGGMRSGATAWSLLRIFLAALFALLAMYGARWLLGSQGYNPGLESRANVIIDVLVMAPIGIVAYLVAAYVLRVHELRTATTLVKKKVSRRS
jgi:putative peptidoglycan lipid II flippase